MPASAAVQQFLHLRHTAKCYCAGWGPTLWFFGKGILGSPLRGEGGSDESLIWRDLPLAATQNWATYRAISYLYLIPARIARRKYATLRCQICNNTRMPGKAPGRCMRRGLRVVIFCWIYDGGATASIANPEGTEFGTPSPRLPAPSSVSAPRKAIILSISA